MRRIGMLMGLLLLSAHFLFAQTVSLQGTVKNSAGAAIAGAKVTLATMKTLSATTDEQGAFSISGGTYAHMIPSSNPQFQLSLAGKR